jgi:hypothetical protein
MSARPPRELVVVGVAATVLTLVGGVAAQAADGPQDEGSAPEPSAAAAWLTTTTAAPADTRKVRPAVPTDPVQAAIQRWFPDIEERARAIAWCESTHNPRAVSPGGANHGLFQINDVHRPDFAPVTGTSWADGRYDPEENAQFARWLYNRQGWEPWACA